jgi:hypothetical protein
MDFDRRSKSSDSSPYMKELDREMPGSPACGVRTRASYSIVELGWRTWSVDVIPCGLRCGLFVDLVDDAELKLHYAG